MNTAEPLDQNDPPNPLKKAVNLTGWQPLANACSVKHQAIRKWIKAGRLPRSEFSGETAYANIIEIQTDGAVTAEVLLEWSRKGWNSNTSHAA